MIIYGRNAVHEALRGQRKVSQVWATTNTLREPWLAADAVKKAVQSGDEIARMCGSDSHQGICAEVSEFRFTSADSLLALDNPLLVVLDQVQDPQNLGAICRSAECAGADGVIVPERRSAPFSAAVCKASAGAVEHLALCEVRNVTDFLTAAKEHGCWCYGAAADGAIDYREVDFSGPTVLVMGSEGNGLRPRVAGACDALVSLPLRGKIDSLSVGAATAVLLYAAAAKR